MYFSSSVMSACIHMIEYILHLNLVILKPDASKHSGVCDVKHTVRSVFSRAFHKCDHCSDRMSNGGDIRKNGPIVIKKSYGFDFGGDFCSYVHKREKKIGSGKVGKKN